MVRVTTAFTALMLVSVLGIAACGDDDGNEVRTVTVQAPADTQEGPPGIGDAILIETRIPDAEKHTGEVLDGSVIGESAFCPGGKTSGGSTGAAITATFSCPGGRLTVSYSPTQRSLVQSSTWEVVSGTGSFKGLQGGGSMVANFRSDNPEKTGETFTGTVTH
jgi:hypothetical protein